MGDALRRLFLSIGVALGLASVQPDPSLFARIGPGPAPGERLVVSARIENSFAPGALELVETGTAVALRFTALVATPTGELAYAETRSIRYDLRSGLYEVSFDGGKKAALVDPQAARTLASELGSLELCPLTDAPDGTRVIVRAEIGIMDSSRAWHDAPVLWNYYGPRAVLVAGQPAVPEAGARAAGRK